MECKNDVHKLERKKLISLIIINKIKYLLYIRNIVSQLLICRSVYMDNIYPCHLTKLNK